MSEGPKDVVSWRQLNPSIYFSNDMGLALSGRQPVMEANFEENHLCLLLVRVFSMLCLEEFGLHSMSCRYTIGVVYGERSRKGIPLTLVHWVG